MCQPWAEVANRHCTYLSIVQAKPNLPALLTGGAVSFVFNMILAQKNVNVPRVPDSLGTFSVSFLLFLCVLAGNGGSAEDIHSPVRQRSSPLQPEKVCLSLSD